MAEISNSTLAVLVVAALVVTLAGTVLNFEGLTGFAVTDTGYVNLTINQTLAIAVDAGNRTINFGTCSPRAGVSYSCISNDSLICDNGTGGSGNCTGDTTTSQFIRLDNVGNVNASVNITSECTAATFIGGTSPAFSFITTQCNGTGVSTWTSFATLTTAACTNVGYQGGKMRLYANVTIPSDATGGSGGCLTQNDVTFSAVLAP